MKPETYFDSHAHICDPKLWDDRQSVLSRAREAGVTEILCVGYDIDSSRRSVELAESEPGVFASVGISPHDVAHSSDSDWTEIERLLSNPKVVAIGETGLDYHYMRSPVALQRESLVRHLRLANAYRKPIILHVRDSESDLFEILSAEGIPAKGGVLHCFTGTRDCANRALEMGLYISFSGIVTFAKSGDLAEILKGIPLESLLLETDCPYLAPVPHRGKTCEPAMLPALAEGVLKLGLSIEAIAATRCNARRLFMLDESPSS